MKLFIIYYENMDGLPYPIRITTLEDSARNYVKSFKNTYYLYAEVDPEHIDLEIPYGLWR